MDASAVLEVAIPVVLGILGLYGGVRLIKRAQERRRELIESAEESHRELRARTARPKLRAEDLEDLKEGGPPDEPPSPAPVPAPAPDAPLPETPPAAPPPGTPAAPPIVARPRISPAPRPEAPPVAPPAPLPTVPEPVAKPSAPTTKLRDRKADAAALAPGLARTRAGWISKLGQIFAGKKTIDPALVDDIEKVLLTADIGIRTSTKLLEDLRASLGRKELADPDAVWAFLRQRATALLSLDAPPPDFSSARPFVLLVIGVNGSGKTTTIGKLSAKLAAEGRKVVMAAGDTFRAAATEQLDIWARRTGAMLVRGKEGADPSSVIFDGVKKAQGEAADVVLADTAGRLHTKADLMEELRKVRRVTGKAMEGAPHETWLVIDSTQGQNAIAQAQVFTEAMQVTGIVLTKLDGTAKGGVILGIADQLRLPVRYVGVGERVEDLREFDAEAFVEALFERESPAS